MSGYLTAYLGISALFGAAWLVAFLTLLVEWSDSERGSRNAREAAKGLLSCLRWAPGVVLWPGTIVAFLVLLTRSLKADLNAEEAS